MILDKGRLFGVLVFVAFLTSACDTVRRANENHASVEQDTSARFDELRDVDSGGLVDDAGQPYFGEVIYNTGLHGDGSPIPSDFDKENAIDISVENATIGQIFDLISLDAGIRIALNTAYVDDKGAPISVPVEGRFSLAHKGSLTDLFDMIADLSDTTWRYDGVRVVYERMTLVSYNLPVLPYASQVSSSVGSSGAGESGGGTSSVGVSNSFTHDPWLELAARLDAFAPAPTRITISRGVGLVDVFATPSVHAMVEKIIKEITDIYSQTIQIDVGIYFVNVADVDDFAIGLGVNEGELSVVGAVGQLTSERGAFSFNSDGGFVSGGNSGQLRAYAESSSVADSYFASTRVQPGVMVPLVHTESINYVSGVAVTTSDSTTQTSLTTSEFESGISMYSVAQLSSHGDIVVDVTISQTALKEIKSFSSGNSTVQLPNTSQRIIKGSGVVRSGGGLILAGYEQDYSNVIDKGTGVPENKLIGGGSTTGDVRRVQMIVVVRPTLIGS